MAAPIRFLSGRQQQQKIGIPAGSDLDKKVLEVVGRVGIGTTIFDADYDLDVRGDASISGILTANKISADILTTPTVLVSLNDLNVAGIVTVQEELYVGSAASISGNLSVTGLSTFSSDLDIDASVNIQNNLEVSGNLTVTGLIDFDELNVIGVSTFQDDINVGLGATVAFFDISTGTIGIGSTQPESTLDINGTLNVSGVSTFNSDVNINANLDVDGRTELDTTNISETLNVVGLSTFDSNVHINASIDVDGLSDLDELNVAGLSTFDSNVDINASIDVDGLSDLDELNVTGIATFASDLDVNASVDISSNLTVDGLSDLDELNVAGLSTFASDIDVNASVDISSNLTVNGLSDLDELNVAGLSTFVSDIDVNASVDVSNNLVVDGLSDLDELNVAGIATFASDLDVNASVDVSNNLVVDGLSGLDELNVAGIATFNTDVEFVGSSAGVTSAYWDSSANLLNFKDNVKATFGDGGDLEIFHDGINSIIDDVNVGSLVLRSDTSILLRKRTGNENQLVANPDGAVELYYDNSKKFETTGIGVSILNGASDTATIAGPANLIIDPAAVGDNTGNVRIKGDLYVDGTTTQINSTTIELADFIVGIATTATTDLLADGAGIQIGPDNTFLYEYNGGINPSLKSSENLNVASGKAYQINQTERLSANTLSLGTGTTIHSPATNELILGTNDQERVRISELGLVGIGTADPTEDLHVEGDLRVTGAFYDSNNLPGIAGQTLLSTASGTEWTTSVSAAAGQQILLASEPVTYYITAADRSSGISSAGFIDSQFVLDQNANVGIGSTQPTAKLDVSGDANITGVLTVTTLDVNRLSPDGSNFGTAAYVPVANGSGGWTWGTILDTGAGTLSSILLFDEGTLVSTAGTVTQLDIRGNNVIATGVDGGTIGTITVSDNPTFESLSVNGISSFTGISTFSDRVIFDSTNSIQIPVGTEAQKDSVGVAVTGQIRYNTTNQQFEGFGVGNNWGSLGGVKDVDGDTYILAETTAGSDEDILYFYTGTNLSGTISSTSGVDFNVDLNVDGHIETDTLNVSGVSTFQGNVNLGDDDRLRFGDGNDLQIYHDGSNSFIDDTGTGDLVISATHLRLRSAAAETYLLATANSSVELYYDNSKKFETTGYGVTVSGGLNVSGISTFQGNVTFGADLLLGDNVVLRIGDQTNGDLKLYHDGSNSYIQDSGDGNLILRGDDAIILEQTDGSEKYAQFNKTGSVELYYDNVKKFETTGYGVTVSGGLNVSGVSTFIGAIDANGDLDVLGLSTFRSNVDINASVDILTDLTVNGNLEVDGHADLDDLTVTGVTTTGTLYIGAAGTVGITTILDEDNMVSNSDTALATQQSIKTYIDNSTGNQDLNFSADSGTGAINLATETLNIEGTANQIQTEIAVGSGNTVTISLTDDVTLVTSLTVGTATTLTNDGIVAGVITATSLTVGTATTLTNNGIVAGVITATTLDSTNATIDNLTFTGGTAITSVDTDLTTVSASDDTLASAKAIKTYVDNTVNANNQLNFTDGTTSGSIDLNVESLSVLGTNNEVTVEVTSEGAGVGNTITIGIPDDVIVTTSLTVGTATTLTNDGITATNITGTLNNTLTLETFGTGLSGSATYNNSGVSTFTVTSNATPDNTSSTIVSRDGSGNFSAGTITADLTGVASTATELQNARTFQLTGDVVAAPISFDGTGNVSLAATIQPNSVGLGTDTFGDYVKSITGTAGEIEVDVTSGEGVTPQIGLPSNVTIGNNLTVTNDLFVQRDLFVDGSLSIGGTSATLFTQTLEVEDANIILGIKTDIGNNIISNDSSATAGGIAIASTEGTPIVDFTVSGIDTISSTYKKLLWFQEGSLAGLGTDAWMFNYGVGIGSTQIPFGTRLAVGNVQVTDDEIDLQSITIRDKIYDSGDSPGINNYVLTSGGPSGSWSWQSVSAVGSASVTILEESSSLGNFTDIDFVGSNITAAAGAGVTATVTLSESPTFNNLNVSGLTTTNNLRVVGIATVNTLGVTGITTTNNLRVTGISTINGYQYRGSSVKTASIYVRGTGLNAGSINRNVYLNGNLIVNTSSRGLTLTILNDSLEEVSSTNYDTYGSNIASTNLATALGNLTTGQIAILSSYDSFEGNVNDNLRAAALRVGLTKLGTFTDDFSANRRPYAAVFYGTSDDTNARPQEVIERMESSDADAPEATIFCTIAKEEGNNSVAIQGAASANALYSSDSEFEDPRVVVDSQNRVGIASLSPLQLLDVFGSARIAERIYDSSNSAGGANAVLTSGGPSGTWSWQTVSAVGGAQIDIYDEDVLEGTFSAIKFVSINLDVTSGVGSTATVTLTNTPTFTDLNVTGISTIPTVSGLTTFKNNVEFEGNVDLQDNDRLRFGNGDDLQIYHDSINTYIQDSSSGSLYIDSDNLIIRSGLGTEYVHVTESGEVGIGSTQPTTRLDVVGNSKFDGNISLGNSDELRFGDGIPSLIIKHDTANTYITEQGTGDLIISSDTINLQQSGTGDQLALFNGGASVELYHNNSKKFETIGTGVSITGNIDIDDTTVIGSATASLSTLTQTAIHTELPIATYRSVEYTIQATEGTNFHATKILALHNGTTAYHSEYGTIFNNSSVASFDVDVSGGNLRLLATGASASQTDYVVNFVATKV